MSMYLLRGYIYVTQRQRATDGGSYRVTQRHRERHRDRVGTTTGPLAGSSDRGSAGRGCVRCSAHPDTCDTWTFHCVDEMSGRGEGWGKGGHSALRAYQLGRMEMTDRLVLPAVRRTAASQICSPKDFEREYGLFGCIGCSSSTGQYFGWHTAPPGGPLFEKKPGACSEEMLTRRGTPNITHASTTAQWPKRTTHTGRSTSWRWQANAHMRRGCTAMHSYR